MALPCVDDSCSIQATKNPTTRHLQLHAKVHPGGGLYEHPACDGLAVQIIGEPDNRAAVDQGLVQLGLTPGGELWAAPAKARTENFGGGAGFDDDVAARIEHNGQESLTANIQTNPISDNVLTNPYTSPAIVIVTGTYRLGWTVPEVAAPDFLISTNNGNINYTPYHAKIRAQIIAAIGDTDPGLAAGGWPAAIAANTAAPQKTAFFDIGGMARNDKAPQHLRDWRDFVFALIVPQGKKVFLAAQASHNGDLDIRTFVDTETFPGAAPVFADRGIRASGEAIWLPFNGQAV